MRVVAMMHLERLGYLELSGELTLVRRKGEEGLEMAVGIVFWSKHATRSLASCFPGRNHPTYDLCSVPKKKADLTQPHMSHINQKIL